MKRRITAIIIIALLLIALIPSTAFAATSGKWGSNITWKYSNGTLTFSGKGDIPAREGKTKPWREMNGIKKIVIKEGITSIPKEFFSGSSDPYESYSGLYPSERIFGTSKTTTVVLPSTLKSIGLNAFDCCPLITDVSVSKSGGNFEYDENGVLYNTACDMLIYVPKDYEGHLEIREGTKSISNFAGIGCTKLTGVTFPEGMTVIARYSFHSCPILRKIILPSTLETIDYYAFDYSGVYLTYYNGYEDEFFEKVQIESGNRNILMGDLFFLCDHENPEVLHPATCTTPTVYRCSECNEYKLEEVTFERGDPLGHDENPIPAVEATCTSTGLTEGTKCSRCGMVFTEQETIPATGHTGEWTITKEATSTEEGTKTRTCTVCGETETIGYSLYKKGDVNKDGSVDAKDATQILRSVNGKTSVIDNFTEDEISALADVNGDESVDAKDATQILRHVNGKTSVFDSM